tara:strand:- start:139 stop:1827 length:1689 start_codon:yes stop_codon:yes gene_type:complete
MATKKEKWQAIADRGLQDKFDPDTRAKFDEAVSRGLITMPQSNQQLTNQAVTSPATDHFIPTDENLALEQARVDAIPERTFGEKAEGAFEAVKTLGTGATTGALGFGVGTLTGIIGELTGRLKTGEGLEEAQALAAKFTDLPESEAGQEYVKGIGETLGTLPPVGLTGGVIPKIKLPKSINRSLSSIAESAPEGVQKSFTKKLGEDRFSPRIFGLVKEARKQGFDDSVTTLIANSSPTTKRRMLQQVGVVERGKGDARLKALERTADIAGDSLVKKIDFVKGNNKQAGQQLNRVSKTLKGKDVDVNEPVNKFINDLDELGVTFDDNGKPNFSGSQIEGVTPAESLINKITNRIKNNPTPDALQAHQFKKFIDENVSFGKSAAEGLSGKTESVVKSLRKGVNESINNISGPYKDANKIFSDTITALDDLQDVAGRKLDFSGPNADKAAGVLLRSQTNNTKGRANLLTAISNLEDTAQKYGGSFDDDILNLSILSDELDAVFGSGARTSLRGEVGKAGIDTAIDVSQMTIPGAIAVGAKAGAKRIRGINEMNQIKAIKKLLKSK